MTSEPPQPTEWVITIAVIARPLTAAVTCTALPTGTCRAVRGA
jgi:hypothetical protein